MTSGQWTEELKKGENQNIKCNTFISFPFNRYVQGRPRLLDNELPRIQFLEDRSGSEQRLLSSKITQQDLSNNMQYQIETELKSLPDLCQLLESVYTAKDFLMEAGGQHDLSLAKFLVSDLSVAL